MSEFIKVYINFLKNDKMAAIYEDYENAPINERPNDVKVALINLWLYCREDKKDGVLGKNIRRIERRAGWRGKRGRLLEILTNEETRFIDIVDGAYIMHNWYKWNKDLEPKQMEKIKKSKSKAGHAKAFKEELAMLRSNGVDIDKCPWLSVKTLPGNEEIQRIGVDYKYLPDNIEISSKRFRTREHFKRDNTNVSKAVQRKRLKIIKDFTRACTRCGTYHISTECKRCIKCR